MKNKKQNTGIGQRQKGAVSNLHATVVGGSLQWLAPNNSFKAAPLFAHLPLKINAPTWPREWQA